MLLLQCVVSVDSVASDSGHVASVGGRISSAGNYGQGSSQFWPSTEEPATTAPSQKTFSLPLHPNGVLLMILGIFLR